LGLLPCDLAGIIFCGSNGRFATVKYERRADSVGVYRFVKEKFHVQSKRWAVVRKGRQSDIPHCTDWPSIREAAFAEQNNIMEVDGFDESRYVRAAPVVGG
jgi:hypothetical protein